MASVRTWIEGKGLVRSKVQEETGSLGFGDWRVKGLVEWGEGSDEVVAHISVWG